MTASERLSCERVSLADLNDDEFLHDLDDRARMLQYVGAMLRGAYVPPVFLIRQAGKLDLIQGSEQIAAAEELGIDELNAVVFEALSDAEADEVGAVGFQIAEDGLDVLVGLQLAYGAQRGAARVVAA